MTGEELRRIMWGRESISTPTKAPKKKKLEDPYDIQNASAVAVALETMTFTQEIIMGDPIALQPGGFKPGSKSKQSNNRSKQRQGMTSTSFKDPLRELVLISEETNVSNPQFLTNVKTLAKAATILDNVKEINVGEGISAAKYTKSQQNRPTITDNVSQAGATTPNQIPALVVPNIATTSLFQNPIDIIDPKEEKEFLRKLKAIENTDSEGIGEEPILGKISLFRRAKSAVSRSSSIVKKVDEHPLFQIAWDEIIDASQDNGSAYVSVLNATRFVLNNKSGGKDEEDESVIITVNEVKRNVKQFHKQRKSSSDSIDSHNEINTQTKYIQNAGVKYAPARKSLSLKNK